MKYRNTIFTAILLALGCVVLSPATHARQQSEDRGNGNSAAEGVEALNPGTTGSNNTAHGWFSLFSNTSGSSNTADGFQALYSNTTGNNNAANGFNALFNNTTGSGNTATGRGALFANTTGFSNTASGAQALTSNTTGGDNTANGYLALSLNTTGFNNTASGFEALLTNTTGAGNTAVGVGALVRNTTGGENIALGANAGFNVTTANNVICIGSLGADVSNSCFIGHIRGAQTVNADALPVIIDSAGQLGTVNSSRRFKRDIKPMEKVSESILALKPVTFRYKSDKTNRPEFGLIAEEVAETNPDLVVRDENREIYTVRYDAINAMLLNEFLKEHRRVEQQERRIEEQDRTIAQLRKDMQSVVAHAKEQDSKIQSVSAQLAAASPSRGELERSKFAVGRIRRGGATPSVVLNNPLTPFLKAKP